ncbi:hypothetical protein [Bacillus marasmi]|uniref:hypothetical protein n=1 Tax=Bacillus marasmi TaxID=1926279 RepID=UPI0011C95295|nr:hypothetical protein [Bacillus marasmi]
MYQNPFERDQRKQSDPFRHFLFGNKAAQKQFDQKPQQNQEQRGQRQRQRTQKNQDMSFNILNPASIEKYLNNIDMDLLNENIDMLMKTAEQFKPLYNELNPIIAKFLKKK